MSLFDNVVELQNDAIVDVKRHSSRKRICEMNLFIFSSIFWIIYEELTQDDSRGFRNKFQDG